jgi:hypothetical protein
MFNDFYILFENNNSLELKKIDSPLSKEWQDSLDKYKRIAITHLNNITVSTVFLGIDHRHHCNDPPLLFETMVFTSEGCGNPIDDITKRYSSIEEARKGHDEIVRSLKLKVFW